MLIQIIFLPLHALWCYIFVFQLNLGFHGTTIAFNLTNFLSFTSIILFTKVYQNLELQQLIIPFNSGIFKDMTGYIRLAIYGLLLSCFEEWCNQAITIFSGLIGVNQQAALAIVFSIMILMFYVPQSFGFAISALVGGAVGSGNVLKAKRIVSITLCMSFVTIAFIIALTTMNLRNIV